MPIKKKELRIGKGVDNEGKVIPSRRKYSGKRWIVERTNSWYSRFRKLFTRYEKKVENYLGLVQFSCCMITYRKIILGQALSGSACHLPQLQNGQCVTS